MNFGIQEAQQVAGGKRRQRSSLNTGFLSAAATAITLCREPKDPSRLSSPTVITTGATKATMEAPAMKYGAAAIFSAIGVAGSVVSMVRLDPSGWLITMTIASYFCFLVVFFSDRIESFSLRDLAAKLKEIESRAASSEMLAEKAAEVALETLEAAKEVASSYDSSSGYEDESWDGSSDGSHWSDADQSADELRQKLNAQQGAARQRC